MAKQKNKALIFPKLLDYQKEMYNLLGRDDVKVVTFVKSRQSGGSFFNKIMIGVWGLGTCIDGKTSWKIGYITPTAKLSKLFFREVIDTYKDFIEETNSTDLYIKFKTGSNVQFLSAEAENAIRGFQFHYLVIDEAAYVSDNTFNMIISPTQRIIGKKTILTSTPFGANGFFYNHSVYGNDEDINGYKTVRINIHDNPYVSEEDIAMIKRMMPERAFRQEYMSEFLDGSGTVFSNYKNCVNDRPEKTGIYYAGIDWGKTDDYTVLTIINNKGQVMYIYRINAIEYTKQVDLIVARLNEWKPREVISEENSIGTVINEMLKKKYRGKIRTVSLHNALKVEIIEQLIVAFEQETISIPNDDTLMTELQAFTCTYNNQTHNVKYSAPIGLHDDMVLSLAYAYSNLKRKRSGTIRVF